MKIFLTLILILMTFSLMGMRQPTIADPENDWFVSANIGGANIGLSVLNKTDYTVVDHASIDMVLRSGSAQAEIPCTSTSPPTGLTCSAGNETVGVAFTPPFAGKFQVCMEFGHQMHAISGDAINVIWQLIETPINAETITQEGGSRINSHLRETNASLSQIGNSIHLCGLFDFYSVSKKAIRLMYEQDLSNAPPLANQIQADRSATLGKQDIHITVFPIHRF